MHNTNTYMITYVKPENMFGTLKKKNHPFIVMLVTNV